LLETRDDDRRIRSREAMNGWAEAKAKFEQRNSVLRESAHLFPRDSDP
jgi:hypothetical protein